MTNNLLLRKRGGFDELYTPANAIWPLLKFIKPNSKILCPFDDQSTNYVIELKKAGHNVTYSHQWDGKDFFSYTANEVKEFDYIISNPPYSIKDKVLNHLYKLNKPFAMLLPISSLAGIYRGKLFNEKGVQVLVLNRRLNFIPEKGKSSYFNTSYFCSGLLPQQLMFIDLPKLPKDE